MVLHAFAFYGWKTGHSQQTRLLDNEYENGQPMMKADANYYYNWKPKDRQRKVNGYSISNDIPIEGQIMKYIITDNGRINQWILLTQFIMWWYDSEIQTIVINIPMTN